MRYAAKKKKQSSQRLRILTLRSIKNDVSISTSTSTTRQACLVIEKHVLPASNNWYRENKPQRKINEQRNFIERMGYRAKRKASEQPVAKKPKLTRAQEE